jgi:hypothetical protein
MSFRFSRLAHYTFAVITHSICNAVGGVRNISCRRLIPPYRIDGYMCM